MTSRDYIIVFFSFCAGLIGGIGFTLICVAHHLWR